MKAAIEKHPVLSFTVIAFSWTWPLAGLIGRSMVFPLLALFGPCVAAVVVLYALRGPAGLRRLASKFRFSRALVLWCIVAAALPLTLLLPIWLLYCRLGGGIPFELNALSMLSVVVAVLIVGEEIGWRGFLLPHLLQRYPPFISSVVVGLIWAVWHLPNFLSPNYPHYWQPFSAFVVMTLAFSLLFTWFYLNTSGSLLIAVIFHAALNLFSLAGVEPSLQFWLKTVVYSVAAIVVWIVMLKYRGWGIAAAFTKRWRSLNR